MEQNELANLKVNLTPREERGKAIATQANKIKKVKRRRRTRAAELRGIRGAAA